MSSRAFRLAGGVVLALLATSCRTQNTDEGTVEPTTGEAAVEEEGPAPATANRPNRRAGFPHNTNIDAVVVSQDGSCALTRDQGGSLRFWPSLDGGIEPIYIPGRAQSMAVGRQGKTDKWTIVLVDGTGGVEAMSVDTSQANDPSKHDEDLINPLFRIEPVDPILDAVVVPNQERVLLLGRDHVLRLVGVYGGEVARFEKRDFRPNRLQRTADGTTFAISIRSRLGGVVKVRLHEVSLGEAGIEIVGDPFEFEVKGVASEATLAISPNGERIAFLERDDKNGWWEVEEVELGTKKRNRVALEAASSGRFPMLGYADDEQLIYTDGDFGKSLLVHPGRKKVFPRLAPQNIGAPAAPVAHARDLRVIGQGPWLIVDHPLSRSSGYLGYLQFQPQSVALSPDGTQVAWGLPATIEIEQADGTPGVTIHRNEGGFSSQLVFLDDRHVASVSSSGGLYVYDIHDGSLKAENTLGTGVREFRVDHENGLLLAMRYSGDIAVFEYEAGDGGKGLIGPYLIEDMGYQAGFGSGDEPSIWTSEGSGKLRTYTLAELRSDLDRETQRKKGDEAYKPLNGSLLNRDGKGRMYMQTSTMNVTELARTDAKGTKEASYSLGSRSVMRVVPTDSQVFVLVTDSSGASALLSLDADSMELQWSYAIPVNSGMLQFDHAGGTVAISETSGGLLLNAATGERIRGRCGGEFRLFKATPTITVAFNNAEGICAR